MTSDTISPGSTIGILGGGQLGRMTALAAAELGYACAILTPDRDAPASQVSALTILADYTDEAALAKFAAAVDVLFADPNIGHDAVYTPDGGAAVLVRVVVRRADAITEFGEARLWSETTRIDLRVAEVPAPRPGDRIEIDGEAFLLQGEPVRDRERLVWTVDLRPV